MARPKRFYRMNHKEFQYDADKYEFGQVTDEMQKWIDENVYSYQSYAIDGQLSATGRVFVAEIIVYESEDQVY